MLPSPSYVLWHSNPLPLVELMSRGFCCCSLCHCVPKRLDDSHTPHIFANLLCSQAIFACRNSCATDENVVDGDVDQLDNVANEAHDQDYISGQPILRFELRDSVRHDLIRKSARSRAEVAGAHRGIVLKSSRKGDAWRYLQPTPTAWEICRFECQSESTEFRHGRNLP